MEKDAEIDAETLAGFIALVRKHTGMAITEKKSVMLQGRLRPRLRALALKNYRDYLEFIRNDFHEVQSFINVVTTNDTSFFRTPHVWEFFSAQYLRDWYRDHQGEVFKIWSAAASTGEEAYSIAMLCEEFRLQAPRFQYQILATDISSEVLDIARQGVYRSRSIEAIKASHPRLLDKYFKPHVDGMRVSAELQNHIRFAEHNLLTQWRGGDRFDIVFLRNALIYFEAENQERIVTLASKLMKEDAKLILGESESLSRMSALLHHEMPLVYRLNRSAS